MERLNEQFMDLAHRITWSMLDDKALRKAWLEAKMEAETAQDRS